MAATLRPDSPDNNSAAAPADPPEGHIVEHIECAGDSCDARYVMAYSPDDARSEDGESLLDTMREKAAELVASTHSLHDFRNYVWSGLQNGWVVVEKDLTAAGL
jgi:hypothetical protein